MEDFYEGDGLNLYAYCRNNPIVYYDPSGYATNENGKHGEGEKETKELSAENFLDGFPKPDEENKITFPKYIQALENLRDRLGYNDVVLGLTEWKYSIFETPPDKNKNRKNVLIKHMEKPDFSINNIDKTFNLT